MKPTSAKLLHTYQNGNVTVTLYEDGTKVREWPDGESPRVTHPESCDLKITQYCDLDSICVYCFTPDTKIMLGDGSTKNIRDIQIDDIVVSYNDTTSQYEMNPVYNLFSRDVDENIVVIELEDGSITKVTGNHKIYTQRGKIRADELLEDDEIVYFINNIHEDS